MYAYLLLSIMFIAYSSREEGALLLFSLVSYNRIVSLAPNFGISLGWIPVVFYIVKNLFIPFKLNLKVLLFYLLFTLYMCIGLNPAKEGFFSDIKTIVNYTFLFVILFSKINQIGVKLFDFYIVGHLLGIILSFPVNLSPRFSELLTIAYTDTSSFNTLRFWGIDFDTNFFSANCAFIISCLLFFLANEHIIHINKKRILIALIIYIIFGTMTFSKTFFVCVGLLGVYYYSSNLSKKMGNFVVVMITGIGLFIVINEMTGGMLFETTFGRFIETGSSIDTLTTGRFHIWQAYIEDWKSSISKVVFGVGMAN